MPRVTIQQYEAQVAKRDKASAERGRVASAVWAEINEARGEIRERQRVIDTYNKYVELADGDRVVAWRFLMKAEKLTEEQVKTMKLEEAIQLNEFVPDWRPAESVSEDAMAV